jgi:hypothetical protein
LIVLTGSTIGIKMGCEQHCIIQRRSIKVNLRPSLFATILFLSITTTICRVTIAGESAGAMSVTYHLISPKSIPFFSGAIVQSNPVALKLRTKSEMQTHAATFAFWAQW